jgi:urease accessory protein UreH
VDRTGTAVRPLRAASDDRPSETVGRLARLELRFIRRNNRTVLAEAYAEPPFRVGRCFAEGDGIHLIMATTGPGIFGGDAFSQTVHVERGARVRLTSQSSMQVHPSADGQSAALHTTYVVDDEAELHCHWDPLIPFAASTLAQHVEVNLAPSAVLYWSDAFMSGRHGRGEHWAFATLANELRVSRAGLLEYLERYRLAPADGSLWQPWVAADACYFGTTLVSGPIVQTHEVEQAHGELARASGVLGAVDRLDDRLILARLTSADGPAFHNARIRLRDEMTTSCSAKTSARALE